MGGYRPSRGQIHTNRMYLPVDIVVAYEQNIWIMGIGDRLLILLLVRLFFTSFAIFLAIHDKSSYCPC